jgi:hypothetical protein
MSPDVRGWERGNEERLPPGYRMDTTDAAVWILRRPDGTVAGYFGVWGGEQEVRREGGEGRPPEESDRLYPEKT